MNFTNYLHIPTASVTSSKAMKNPKNTIYLIITVLSTWAWQDFAAAEGKKPLNNLELHQLCEKLSVSGDAEVPLKIKGTEVKIRVKIHIRQDKTVWCTVLNPDQSPNFRCGAHLTGFEPHFSSAIKNNKEYLLEGMIVEDKICYSAFWIYASRLTRAEQSVAPQSATPSDSDSEGGDKPQPESEKRSR